MSDDLRELLAKSKGPATEGDRSIAGHPHPLASARGYAAIAGARLLRLDGLDARVPDPWGLDALRGRLVELSARGATATLTTAIELVLEAQREAEPVAWVTLSNTTFYPPDVADSGVDLAALVIVRVLDATAAARAAERLLRSGAFGLVILDFGGASPSALGVEIPLAHQGRLVTLAQTHDAAVVCITEKPSEAPSLGSLVSLRAEAMRLAACDRDHNVTLRVLKDKRRGPGWSRTIKLRGPAGF